MGLGNPLADQGDKPLDHWVSVLFAIEDTAFTRENVGKESFLCFEKNDRKERDHDY